MRAQRNGLVKIRKTEQVCTHKMTHDKHEYDERIAHVYVTGGETYYRLLQRCLKLEPHVEDQLAILSAQLKAVDSVIEGIENGEMEHEYEEKPIEWFRDLRAEIAAKRAALPESERRKSRHEEYARPPSSAEERSKQIEAAFLYRLRQERDG